MNTTGPHVRLLVAASLLAGFQSRTAFAEEHESRFAPDDYTNRIQMHQTPFSVRVPDDREDEKPIMPDLPESDETTILAPKVNVPVLRPRTRNKPDKKKKNWILPPTPDDLEGGEQAEPSGWGWLADSVRDTQLRVKQEEAEAEAEAEADETGPMADRKATDVFELDGVRERPGLILEGPVGLGTDVESASGPRGDAPPEGVRPGASLEERAAAIERAYLEEDSEAAELERNRRITDRRTGFDNDWRREGIRGPQGSGESVVSPRWSSPSESMLNRGTGRDPTASSDLYRTPLGSVTPALPRDAGSAPPLPGLFGNSARPGGSLLHTTPGLFPSAPGGSTESRRPLESFRSSGPLRLAPETGIGSSFRDRSPATQPSGTSIESFGTSRDVWSTTPGAWNSD